MHKSKPIIILCSYLLIVLFRKLCEQIQVAVTTHDGGTAQESLCARKCKFQKVSGGSKAILKDTVRDETIIL